MPIRVAVQWAVDLALDLGQLMESPGEPATARSEPCWERPPLEWFKCNADGAFYDQQWKGATGVVLRDDSGVFVRGIAKWYEHCLDALTMEALACRDGLAMALQLGIQKVWLESDCQEVVRLWQVRDQQRSSVMSILKEIKELSTLFQEFKFSFPSRSCNRVAHALAKQVTCETRVGWWSIAPACVSGLLSSDCNPPYN
ncbi:unnamed protein product [Miscanthus lutarioriparius]|uniref:RNase H type-1 domain-containing protein n=1 Tax=Miscanthus lutarioriparius TaxID=422564 RepID=A0A811PCS9_9POAL|nr:unnamed protein product [Miscanthus lutarioriparius]